MKKIIAQELKQVEKQNEVSILFAVESGSRSWGIASPDSDYDVRFVYVRPLEEYVRLDETEDMIKWKLDKVLDINGWDLSKFTRLCAEGNSTPFEWMNSPVVYYRSASWEKISETCRKYFSEKSAVNHYCGLASSTWSKYLTGKTVMYKKYFYALRPLLSANYIEKYHEAPPMLFSDLLELELPQELRVAIEDLVERKKITDEKEESPHIPIIRDFIWNEIERQKEICHGIKEDRNHDWKDINRCFWEVISKKDT